jgi:hypothetical protein
MKLRRKCSQYPDLNVAPPIIALAGGGIWLAVGSARPLAVLHVGHELQARRQRVGACRR